ncbi:hypothetical protein AB0M87_04750 [Streptomyces sp. NPDC051320]|uniref:hypothetical protein n=1 Tax=Streptomyces sp. NPDC051320 TaxID=3154644 RepID=UPI00342C6B2F
MTATTHIAARRINRSQPKHRRDGRLTAFLLRHSRRVQARYFESMRQALPVADPFRHDLENRAYEDLFAHLAIDHPDLVTPADGGEAAAAADHQVLLLALCDEWFREAFGPERTWSPQTIARYQRLQTIVRDDLCHGTTGGAP